MVKRMVNTKRAPCLNVVPRLAPLPTSRYGLITAVIINSSFKTHRVSYLVTVTGYRNENSMRRCKRMIYRTQTCFFSFGKVPQ